MNNLFLEVDKIISSAFVRQTVKQFLTDPQFIWGYRTQESRLFSTKIRGLSIYYVSSHSMDGYKIETWCWYHTQLKVRRPVLCTTTYILASDVAEKGRMDAFTDAMERSREDIAKAIFLLISGDADYMASWKRMIMG